MRKFVSGTLIILLANLTMGLIGNADDNINVTDKNLNETELNVFTGMFDFSDDKQASGLLGLQHQNDELFRQSFLGK